MEKEERGTEKGESDVVATFVESIRKRYSERTKTEPFKVANLSYHQGFKEDAIPQRHYVLVCGELYYHLRRIPHDNDKGTVVFVREIVENTQMVGDLLIGETGMNKDEILREGRNLIMKMMERSDSFDERIFVDLMCYIATGKEFSPLWKDLRSEPSFFSVEKEKEIEREPKAWCRFM